MHSQVLIPGSTHVSLLQSKPCFWGCHKNPHICSLRLSHICVPFATNGEPRIVTACECTAAAGTSWRHKSWGLDKKWGHMLNPATFHRAGGKRTWQVTRPEQSHSITIFFRECSSRLGNTRRATSAIDDATRPLARKKELRGQFTNLFGTWSGNAINYTYWIDCHRRCKIKDWKFLGHPHSKNKIKNKL